MARKNMHSVSGWHAHDGPQTVALVIDELDQWRGTETHLYRLLQRLDRTHLRPVVIALGKYGLAPAFADIGIRFHSLPIPAVISPSGPVGLGRLVHRLSQERADLVVSYHTAADLLAPLAGAALGIPVLSCRRDMGFTKKPVHVRIQRYLNPLLSGMISVSHAVAAEVQSTEDFPVMRHRVIWNGEDLDLFSEGPSRLRDSLGIRAETTVITCVGGLSAVKDHYTMLGAYGRVSSHTPNLCLLLAGDGSERPRLEQVAESVPGEVRFLGQRDDVPDLLRGSDIYVQTSLTEGFSNAILQAMATALPVVTTRVGGNPELVTEESGFLSEAGDAEGVAAGLEQLIKNRTLRQEMGQAGRAWARAHGSLEVMTAAYDQAFHLALNRCFISNDAKDAA